eukprot:CAMPEP_0180576952 /NCGR_PEP_ID=MMETSP1037_2-20121125/11687_1 /TAXON_ID=632150 /ORGANISM="Azadinium spinosum, Strain 3D9" /LENGTH=43 /DNA_ID= /DNA_START= /DNA_END= /DNA_ORIENTATION=
MVKELVSELRALPLNLKRLQLPQLIPDESSHRSRMRSRMACLH